MKNLADYNSDKKTGYQTLNGDRAGELPMHELNGNRLLMFKCLGIANKGRDDILRDIFDASTIGFYANSSHTPVERTTPLFQ